MPTITATVYAGEAYVLVQADWTDQPTVKYARVVRVNTVTGEEVLLRPYIAYNAGGDLLLTCGLGLWWDTEPPLDVPVIYRTEAADVAVILNQNSSFETGTAPWTIINGVLTQSAVFSHEGAFSGLVTPAGGVTSPIVTQTPIAITPGLDVTASLWVLSPQGWNTVTLELLWLDGAAVIGGTAPVRVREIIDDAEWRFLTVTGSPPALADGVTLRVSMTLPPATVLFYLDQFQVTQQLPLGVSVATSPVTVAGSSRFFLKDPLNPCHDLQLALCIPGPRIACGPAADPGVMVQAYGPQDTYRPNTVLLEPVNRRRPIPVYRVRRDAESLLTLMSRTCADRDAVLLLNEPGTSLFFQAPAAYCITDRYLSVGNVTVERLVPDHRIQMRRVTLPHVLVDRPEGPANGVCGARIIDLCDIYTSWGSMTLAGLTYEDLLLGLASPSGPGQPPIASLRTWDEVEAEFADWNAVDDGIRTWDDLLNGL